MIMDGNDSDYVAMELVERRKAKQQQAEIRAASNEAIDDTEFNSQAIKGSDVRNADSQNASVASESGHASVETQTDEHSEAPSRGIGKKESGLRSKRGGKALKIHVASPEEENRRRTSHYAGSIAADAPLYPLDLQGHGVESNSDDNSDRSSSFSPEVAANGFGSPIELPDRENFDELSRKQEQDGFRPQVPHLALDSSDDIPLTSKFHPAVIEHSDGDFNEDFLQVGAPKQPWEKSFVKYLIKTGILILLWYTLSSLLTYYNKEMLGKKDLHFPAPILMNTVHFTMQAVVSTIIVRIIPSMRPSVQITWKDYFMRVFPTAVATALDVHLTNESLIFVSVTFETMCKSSAPVFLLMFAFLFKLETPSLRLVEIILIISAGVLLTVAKATDFNLAGFILIMSAAVVSGFRWTVTQLLLQKEEYGLNNPFATMSVLTPIMATVSLFLSFFFDSWGTLRESAYFNSPLHGLSSTALMLLGGTLAFFMVSTEFFLLSVTSAVTLTVAGIAKEVVTILGAIILFKDRFTLLKGIGLVIIIIGVSLYNMYKYKKLHEGEFDQHKYVALQEAKPVFELGDDVDEGSV